MLLPTLQADLWPEGTQIALMYVKWDATYKDVVIFDNEKSQNDYFLSKMAQAHTWTCEHMSYLRPNEPINVGIPYSKAYAYNYCMVTNPRQPVNDEGMQQTYYYFITDTQYTTPQTCQLTLQLDVMMTRQRSILLGSMFLESGHAAICNTKIPNIPDLTGEIVRKYLTVPESLDVGTDYVSCGKKWYPMNDADTHALGRVIVVSACNLAADPGTVEKPSMNVADGQSADNIPSACNVYSMLSSVFKKFMSAMKQYSWVAQGIISVSTFPARLLSEGPAVELFGKGKTGIFMNFIGETDSITNEIKPYIDSENIFTRLYNGFESGYNELAKFYSYPYSTIELTNYNGNSVFIKPELVQGNTINIYAIGCAVAPFARVGIFCKNYGLPDNGYIPDEDSFTYLGLGDNKKKTGVLPSGDFLDTCLWLADFPQFSVINNSYITYMASTSHTRAYQYQSAGWTNAKANSSAQLSYNQANAGMNNSLANTGVGIDANNQRTDLANINAGISGGVGVVGNLASGNIGGALSSAGNAALGIVNNSLSNNITNNAANQIAQNNYGLGQYMANSNLDYANWANAGDYKNAIASINATVQDAALQPPSVVGQMGGQGFAWKQGLVGFAINYKTITGAQARAVGDMWLRYGYNIHRYINFNDKHISALKVMSKFSYWKVLETYITCADANESEISAIRGILEKGVTIWGNPEDIGNVTLFDNKRLNNIEY